MTSSMLHWILALSKDYFLDQACPSPPDPTHRRGFVIRANNIEASLSKHFINHVVYGLLWCPSARWFRGPDVVGARETCENPARDEEMGSAATIGI